MEITNIKKDTGLKTRTSKLAMIAGTAIIASTLFAGTALASGDPNSNLNETQPLKNQFMLSLKNGSGEPINITGSSPEILKEQIKSLIESGKITSLQADKLQAFGNQVTNSGEFSQDKRFILKNSDKTQADGKQMMIVIKNGSGEPISISGSSPEMIKSKVQDLLKAGELTQQMADKIINSLTELPSNDI